ncbi:MAG: hypothetical protein KA224_06915 [Steroidobacteraceae bacterium]|nr:hypothetical protein [Steroidobacteraceae bacterium]
MDYEVIPVWQKLDAALEQEVVAFWLAEKVFAAEGPARARAKEIICIGRGADGGIAGVCSAVAKVVPRLRERLYFYRSYVRAADRRKGLALELLKAARPVLESYEASLPAPQCIGVLLEIENRGLADYQGAALWKQTGYAFIGYSPRGLDMRVRYFDGARLQRLEIRPPAPAAR